MPFVGTDLGDAFDAALTLQPGMVLVFEPVVWDDGRAGHRSEEIVAVTADGYVRLSARRARRRRRLVSRLAACIDLMERDEVDVLLLGREANARTVTAVSRLWLAGTRAFAPGCVVVRRTGAVHLLANTDAVVATDFPVERLYGITWNPEKLLAALGAIDGVRDARRVAVDGMTPALGALVTRACPEPRSSTPDRCSRSCGGLQIQRRSPVSNGLRSSPEPGSRRWSTRSGPACDPARCAARARLRCVAGRHDPRHSKPSPLHSTPELPRGCHPSARSPKGERVVLRAGALRDGWEASLARTYLIGSPSVEQPAPAGWDELVAACVPGATAGALRRRGATVHGAGRGVEAWPDDLVLVPGLMAAIEHRDDTGVRQDIVRVTDTAPVLVTDP